MPLIFLAYMKLMLFPEVANRHHHKTLPFFFNFILKNDNRSSRDCQDSDSDDGD